jgi:hypothetical protein
VTEELPGYLLKLDRGKAHRDCLDKAVRQWVKRNCRAARRFDPQAGEHVVRALIPIQPPPGLSLLIGDCAHNLRSALDHIAYRLATKYSEALADSQLKGIEFPVFSDPKKFSRKTRTGLPAPGSGLAKLEHADPSVVPLVEAMQPYNGEKWEPLAILHDLDRIDKHRELHVSVAKTDSVEIDCGDNARVHQFTFEPPGRIEDGDVLFRFRCVHKLGRSGKMRPKAGATFSVATKEGPEGWAIVEQLEAMEALIRERVIPPLEPFL